MASSNDTYSAHPDDSQSPPPPSWVEEPAGNDNLPPTTPTPAAQAPSWDNYSPSFGAGTSWDPAQDSQQTQSVPEQPVAQEQPAAFPAWDNPVNTVPTSSVDPTQANQPDVSSYSYQQDPLQSQEPLSHFDTSAPASSPSPEPASAAAFNTEPNQNFETAPSPMVAPEAPFNEQNLNDVPPPFENIPPPPASANAGMAVALEPQGGGWGKKLLLGVLVLILLVGLGALGYQLFFASQSNTADNSGNTNNGNTNTTTGQQTELTYWGLWEPNAAIEKVISEYEQAHPGIKINYQMQSPKDYRERLQAALTSGQGPDIFRFHNTWLPMLKNNLQPDTQNRINMSNYFPVVASDVTSNGQVYGAPVDFDTLGLYYNPAMFEAAGESVPTTWDGLRTAAKNLRVPDSGPIQVAGVALGTTNNVDHFSDILGLMLLQNGANPANPTNELTEDALLYYTLFATKDRVWNETLPNSTYAFATEKVAMMFGPSWRAFEIKDINPTLQFATAPVPQLPGPQIAWSTYWVEGVSLQSDNPDEAWQFLQYLSQDENLTKLYTTQSELRLYGEPYPKTSLASQLESQPIIGAFVKQGSYAKSWYLASRTFDNGLNEKLIKYYEDAINRILDGEDPSRVTPTLGQGVNSVLNQYGISVSAPAQQTGDPDGRVTGNQLPIEPASPSETTSANEEEIVEELDTLELSDETFETSDLGEL